MITKFSKWILFITSYIPLFLIFILSNCFDIYNKYISLKDSNKFNLHVLFKHIKINFYLIVIFLILIIISLCLLKIILKRASSGSNFENILFIEIDKNSIANYILVYILPFINIQSNDLKQLSIFFIVFITIGSISVKYDTFYINPILYLFKYNIYSIKINSNLDNSILITKYTVLELKEKGNFKNEIINIRLSKISNNIYYLK